MRCQRLTKGKQHLKSPCISNRLTHTGSFLFSDGCFSAGQIATISLLAVIVASHDNHPVLHECCNCRPFVFIVVRCIARQAYRKVKTSCLENLAHFCQFRCQCWQMESTIMNFFDFTSRSKTTHIASSLFSDRCFSAAQIAKISLLALTVASLDNRPVTRRGKTPSANFWVSLEKCVGHSWKILDKV